MSSGRGVSLLGVVVWTGDLYRSIGKFLHFSGKFLTTFSLLLVVLLVTTWGRPVLCCSYSGPPWIKAVTECRAISKNLPG